MRFLLVLVTAAILTAAGEQSMTVAQLVMFIRSSVQLKQPDRQVAEYLRKIKLTDKLDDRTIEDLQSLGAGAKTVAALRDLAEASASLRVAPRLRPRRSTFRLHLPIPRSRPRSSTKRANTH